MNWKMLLQKRAFPQLIIDQPEIKALRIA